MDGVGAQYDPRVVGTFVTHLPEFEAEILAMRNAPAPTYGIEPAEQLSEAARAVAPAAGLAEAVTPLTKLDLILTEEQRATLSQLARDVSEPRDVDEIARAFAARVKTLVPYESCVLTLVPPHTDEIIAAHAEGVHADLLMGRHITPGEGVTGWVLANRQSFYNADPKLDLPPALAARCADFRTLAACPLIHENELHGVLTLYSATLREYTAEHRQLLEEAVRLLAASLAASSERERDVLNGDSSVPASKLIEVVLKSEMMH
jgi:GAF domain-containing protein